MLAMRSNCNLQLAISEVLATTSCQADRSSPTSDVPKPSPQVPLSKVICAYIRIAGFNEASHALPSFERALEKLPEFEQSTASEFSQEAASWAGLVSRIKKDYWREVLYKDTYGTKRSFYPCPCCGKLVKAEQMKKNLGLDEDDNESGKAKEPKKCDPEAPENAEAAKKRSRKPKRRTVHTRKSGKKVAFDPYGPSTSKVSM